MFKDRYGGGEGVRNHEDPISAETSLSRAKTARGEISSTAAELSPNGFARSVFTDNWQFRRLLLARAIIRLEELSARGMIGAHVRPTGILP